MKLSDLDIVEQITLKESTGFVGLFDAAGVGKVVKGVNTTIDVKPGEIGRQAAKMGFKTTSNGVPPTARSDGKFQKIAMKKQGAF